MYQKIDDGLMAGIIFNWTQREVDFMETSRPLVRTSGELVWVTMSCWHWDMLRWILKDCPVRREQYFEYVERGLQPEGFDQTMQWCLERDYYNWIEKGDFR